MYKQLSFEKKDVRMTFLRKHSFIDMNSSENPTHDDSGQDKRTRRSSLVNAPWVRIVSQGDWFFPL